MTFHHPSLRCAECRYDLRGITAPICPECAHPLALSRQNISRVTPTTLRSIARGAKLLAIGAVMLGVSPFVLLLSAIIPFEIVYVLMALGFVAFTIIVGIGMWLFTPSLQPATRNAPVALRLTARATGLVQGFYVAIAIFLATTFPAAIGVLGMALATLGPVVFAAYARAIAERLALDVARNLATKSLWLSASLPFAAIGATVVMFALPAMVFCFPFVGLVALLILLILNLMLLDEFSKNLGMRATVADETIARLQRSPPAPPIA